VDLHQRILAELSDLESAAQLRTLEPRRGVDLGSNDYLGLSTHPLLRDAARDALREPERMASTGSRLLSGHDEAWDLVEREFAHWVGAGAALYFTSGYAANVGLLSSLVRPEDIVFSDSANHASLIDGIRLTKCRRVIFPHLDLNFLEDELRRQTASPGARIIVVESIFSMEGDRAPLADLVSLARQYQAELIVDEAHATGVCGPHGSGCVVAAGLSADVFATVNTCGKALAAAGAFVCGSEELKRFLINRARTFIFSTALPPYFAAQVSAGMSLAREADTERAALTGVSAFLCDELRAKGFKAGGDSQIVPVVLGENEAALHFAEFLRARGFGVRAIRPPTVPTGTARLRLSVTSKLSKDTLAEVVAAMVEARDQYAPARALSVSR
jgi:8-amino-7-oxononanoate synthase